MSTRTLVDVHKGLLSCSVLRSWWLTRIAALQFLHRVDWVHRVISGGNVSRWGGMGNLADLEYAKRMDSNAAHETLTGTVDFMACEVETQAYLFELLAGKPRGKDRKLPFKFNRLHDMESLWWIATWALHYHVSGGQPAIVRANYAIPQTHPWPT
ncbi:hypothetical protein EDD15DRAFT_2166988 [Pisolithus albus]|nr:hypothetical protein EDD15DRAFT_2166988 [Pisolithus albus]